MNRPVHRLFYAALVVQSLMLGKTCLASTEIVQAQLPSGASAAAPRAPIATEQAFVAARDAFERRNLKALTAARDRLGSSLGAPHPLSPYAQYWWLSANLSQAGTFAVSNANEIRAFLNAHPNSVAADSLRRDWLKILGKLDQWELFSAEDPLLVSDDAEITCHQWRHRFNRNDRDAFTEAKSFWNAARVTPDACDDVFARLLSEKAISTPDVWLRIRTLLENNQLADARKSAALIPNITANFERATAIIGQNPAQYLQREKLQPASQASAELFLFAVTRLARTDAERAASLLEAHGKGLSPNDLAYAWAQVGLYGGMQHDVAALTWFERAGTFPLNDQQAGWKVRAALRAGDWQRVRAAINAMTEPERRESAWRYWLARASEETGHVETARALRDSLSREHNFYGLLAAEELGVPQKPLWQGWKPTRDALDNVMKRPAIERALAFYRLDLRTEGLREWLHGIRNLDDRELLAAAEIARRANIPDRAINTAEKTLLVHDYTQRFPTPHSADLVLQARMHGLDQGWVYGLIRQESRFMADARSRAGAMGLMQLMPATATWAAKKVSMNQFSLARVTDVPVNLSLGSFYLRHVLDDLGHPVLATAGYNAGPGRARRWRALTALEGAVYAESIPFTETRDYVKKVMANAWFYAQQAGETNRRLKEMMGTVPGSREVKGGISSLASVAAGNKTP